MPEARDRKTGDGAAFFVGESYRSANPSGLAGECLDTDAANTLHEIRFNEAVRRLGKTSVALRTDIKGGVRPCRLRQILDRDADLRIAFDEQNVPWFEAGDQPFGRGRRSSPVNMSFPAQIPREDPADFFQYITQRVVSSVQVCEPGSPVTLDTSLRQAF